MRRFAVPVLLAFAILGCHSRTPKTVSGPFSASERAQFAALHPIDAHMHLFRSDPEVFAVLKRLDLHVLDILVVDDTNPRRSSLATDEQEVWQVAQDSGGRVAVCTTFDAYKIGQPDFPVTAIRQINADFARGAIALKVWKNIGMEITDAHGSYILPDDPRLEPIYRDVASHDRTLIFHVADPDSLWQPPNPKAMAYTYLKENPQWYMYGRPGVHLKSQILTARDHVLQQNPDLRVVGAHLGSYESDLASLGARLDQNPNFAVDLAGRLPDLAQYPREQTIAFITRYQDRLIYGTDLEYGFGEPPLPTAHPDWEPVYARQWRFLATNDRINLGGHLVKGLALPQSVLLKLYHDNAVRWYPGILPKNQ